MFVKIQKGSSKQYLREEYELVMNNQNIDIQILAIIQLIFSYLINSTTEDKYMKFFENIKIIKNQQRADNLRDFFERMVSKLNNSSLYESMT